MAVLFLGSKPPKGRGFKKSETKLAMKSTGTPLAPPRVCFSGSPRFFIFFPGKGYNLSGSRSPDSLELVFFFAFAFLSYSYLIQILRSLPSIFLHFVTRTLILVLRTTFISIPLMAISPIHLF